MANYRAVSNGVWSALARWQDDSSGSYVASTVLPGAADVVYANNFTVTLDINVVVSQLRTTSATNVNAGGLFDFGAGNSVTANIFAGTTLCLRNNTGNLKTIIGNATGGSNNDAQGINVSNGSINLNGNATGGSGNSAHGISNNSSGIITINGILTGGVGSSSFGARNLGSGTIIVNGIALGGLGSSSVGALNNSTGIMRVTTSQGSDDNSGVNGVLSNGTTIISNLIWPSNGRIPIIGFAKFDNTAAKTVQVTLENNNTTLLTDNSTVNYPAEADVRNLVQYGPGNIYTGTLVAMFTPDEFLNAISGSSNPLAERLRNVSTVQTTGAQLAALL